MKFRFLGLFRKARKILYSLGNENDRQDHEEDDDGDGDSDVLLHDASEGGMKESLLSSEERDDEGGLRTGDARIRRPQEDLGENAI